MGLRVMIAEKRRSVREGLSTLLVTIPLIEHVYKATTDEELYDHLATYPIDVVFIHQSFVTNISLLPKNRFVILADEPDTHILATVSNQGALGYFLWNHASKELLKLVLDLVGNEHSRFFYMFSVKNHRFVDCM